MNNKHKHEHCNHEGHLHYCEHCNVVYCDACGQEFPEKIVNIVEKIVKKEDPYTLPWVRYDVNGVPPLTTSCGNTDYASTVSKHKTHTP